MSAPIETQRAIPVIVLTPRGAQALFGGGQLPA
jgi:hypothetical protein